MSHEFRPQGEHPTPLQDPAYVYRNSPTSEAAALQPSSRVSNDELARIMHAEAYSNSRRKEAAVAYVLLLFLGGFGAHRFYLGKTGSAVGLLCLTLISMLLTIVVIGFVGLLATAIWCFVDLFLVAGFVREYNESVRRQAYNSV
jgi:TM2 domain-containing membrane protein YozV